MAVTRFFRPIQQEYVSQFIPKNLGVMQQALQTLQNKADISQEQLDIYSDDLLKRNALKGYDTEVLQQKRKEFDNYVAGLQNKDLANPKVARDITSRIRTLKEDKDLAAIQAAYEHDVTARKNIADLIAKGKWAPEVGLDYQRAYEEYTKEGGQGYKGPGLAYNVFSPDAPSRPELEKLVDNVKANSFRYDSVRGMWIDKASGKEVTKERLQNIMAQNFQPFMNTQAGRQMQLRAQQLGVSPQELFLQEAEPVIQERVFKDTGRQLGTNFNFWKQQKAAQEQSYSLVQDGKTQGVFAGYSSMKDYDNAINEFKKTDPKKAAFMEEQKNRLNSNFTKNLSKQEQSVFKLPVEHIRGNETALNMLISDLGSSGLQDLMIRTGIRDFSYNTVKNLPLEKKQEVFDVIKNSDIVQNFGYDLEDKIRNVYADIQGVDYGNLKDKRDEFISKGEIFEAKDIILSSSKGSTAARNYFGDQMKTAVNDINWDVVNSTLEGNQGADYSLEQVVGGLDKQSVKVIDGVNGPEIYFKFKDPNGEIQSMTIQSKDVGSGLQETTNETYRVLAGGDQDLYNGLVESHIYSGIQAVPENSSYNQKQDIQQSLVNIAQSTINNYSPDDQREYLAGTRSALEELDNYNDVKIVRKGNKFQLIADGNSLTAPQESVADLMDELRDTSK